MKIEGIVINSIDYKETSKIVYLYTKMGIISVKATGAKKTKNGALSFTVTGNIVSCVLSDTKFMSLKEYDLIENIFSITNDLDKIKAFSVIIDLIKHIPVDSNHELIYEYVKKVLIDLKKENPKKLLSIYLIKMLYPFGIQPNLKHCAICNSIDVSFLDLSKGLSYCNKCYNGNSSLYNIFREYYYDKKDIKEYSEYDYDLLLSYLSDYYLRYLSLDLKIKN